MHICITILQSKAWLHRSMAIDRIRFYLIYSVFTYRQFRTECKVRPIQKEHKCNAVLFPHRVRMRMGLELICEFQSQNPSHVPMNE